MAFQRTKDYSTIWSAYEYVVWFQNKFTCEVGFKEFHLTWVYTGFLSIQITCLSYEIKGLLVELLLEFIQC